MILGGSSLLNLSIVAIAARRSFAQRCRVVSETIRAIPDVSQEIQSIRIVQRDGFRSFADLRVKHVFANRILDGGNFLFWKAGLSQEFRGDLSAMFGVIDRDFPKFFESGHVV